MLFETVKNIQKKINFSKLILKHKDNMKRLENL